MASYGFDASGYLTFQTYEDYEKAAEIFDKYDRLNLSDFSEMKDKTNGTYYYCDVCGKGYGYNEEDVLHSLAEVIPYVTSGQIDYEGEDSALWRHQFNKEKEEWEELSGKITYENPVTFAKKDMDCEKEEERE